LLTSCGSVPASTSPITVTLGTATPGGGFPVYGAAFAESVHEADPTITIETSNTQGSAENIPLLEASKLDLALVQGEAAYEALAGINRSGPAKLKVVWAIEATSAGLGKGSEFTIRMPLVDGAAGTESAEDDAANREKLAILVVDDNQDAADSLAEVLLAQGHNARARLTAAGKRSGSRPRKASTWRSWTSGCPRSTGSRWRGRFRTRPRASTRCSSR
jgi:hypothetical protein